MSLIMAKCVNSLLCELELDMKIGYLNLRSGKGKSSYIKNRIVKDKLDYFCATESWHCRSDEPFLVSAKPNGYTYEEVHGPNCYEGVVIYHQQSVNTVKLNLPQYQTIQCVGVKSVYQSKEYAVVCVYHAPRYGFTAQFFGELTALFDCLKQDFRFIFVTGDLNIHLDLPTELLPLHAYEVFLSTDLLQNVTVSTHKHGHILDVVLSSERCIVKRLTVHRRTVSDHNLITFSCQLRTNCRKRKVCSRVCPSISHTPLLYVTDLSILKRNGPFDSAIILVYSVFTPFSLL